MTTSIDQPNEASRIDSWKGILDIVESVRELKIEEPFKSLTVDRKIKPNLPTTEECVCDITKRMRQPIPSSLAQALYARVADLRQRTLRSYTEIVSQLASLSVPSGQDDSDVQRQYSRSFEAWFSQAMKELSNSAMRRPHVRISSVALSISSTQLAG